MTNGDNDRPDIPVMEEELQGGNDGDRPDIPSMEMNIELEEPGKGRPIISDLRLYDKSPRRKSGDS